MKVKWQQISDKATAMLSLANTSSGSSRPHVQAFLDILDEAAVLPIPEQAPGGA
jgi:hypothetical protein